jgi:sulfatase maturation enzyme AslB (radical SAM superfamily)
MEKPFLFSPKRCIIEVSSTCNLRCRTCIAGKDTVLTPLPDTLSDKQIMTLQTELKAAGIEHCTYLGAEPFMRPTLLTIARHAKDVGLSTAVVTNGALITPQQIDTIVTENLFNYLVFSLDGSEKIHDSIRGMDGTFAQVTETITALQKKRKRAFQKTPKVFIYVTLSSFNFRHIDTMLRIAQKLDAHAIKFISASNVDERLITATNDAIGKESVSKHSFSAGEHIRIPASAMNSVLSAIADAEQVSKKIGIRFMAEEILRKGYGAESCRFIGNECIVTAQGTVCLCPMLTGYSIGSIHEMAIRDIFSRKSTEEKLLNLTTRCLQRTLPICKECCVEKLSA